MPLLTRPRWVPLELCSKSKFITIEYFVYALASQSALSACPPHAPNSCLVSLLREMIEEVLSCMSVIQFCSKWSVMKGDMIF